MLRFRHELLSRILTRQFLLRGLMLISVAVLLGGLAWWFSHHFTLEELIAHEREWRDRIAAAPWTSLLVGAAVYTAASLVPGTSGKSIVAGWLFGALAGLSIVMTGLVTAAVISFLTGRYLLRDVVEAKLPGTVTHLNRALDHDGPFYLLTLRMTPAPFTLINYASSASRLSLSTFVWTTFIGLLPMSTLLVWVGSTLPTLHALAEHGFWSVLDAPLIVAFVLIGFLPLLTRGLVRLGIGVAVRFRRHRPDPLEPSSCRHSL